MDAAEPGTRWETRRNALEVLRKICKSIMLCEVDVIKHEIMSDGFTLDEFSEDMCELARGMTEQERGKYDEEGLLEKLEELKSLCDWETEMPSLEDLLATFEKEEEELESETKGERDTDDEQRSTPEREVEETSLSTPAKRMKMSISNLCRITNFHLISF